MKNMKFYTKTKFIKNISFAIAMIMMASNIFPFTPYLKLDFEKQVYAESTTKDSIGSNNDSIVLNENIKSIGNSAFENCDNIEYIDVSKNIESINTSAFRKCISLQEVICSNNLKTIGATAFNSCSKLEKITLPISTVYATKSFEGTPLINDITFLVGTGVSNNLQNTSSSSSNSYYQYTPWYGKTIETIIIPEGVTSLGNYMFYNSTKINNIIIPNTVSSIGTNAFYNVSHITYNGFATGSPWGALAIN